MIVRGRRSRTEVPREVMRGVTRAGGYRSVESSLPGAGALAAQAGLHKVLSNRVRLRLLWAIARSDMCPCLLKELTHLSDSKLSYHLKVLTRAGLARVVRRRSWRIYSITENGRVAIGLRGKKRVDR